MHRREEQSYDDAADSGGGTCKEEIRSNAALLFDRKIILHVDGAPLRYRCAVGRSVNRPRPVADIPRDVSS